MHSCLSRHPCVPYGHLLAESTPMHARAHLRDTHQAYWKPSRSAMPGRLAVLTRRCYALCPLSAELLHKGQELPLQGSFRGLSWSCEAGNSAGTEAQCPHAGSMFWILQPATHNDYDGYSIYTDPARYPHDPKPIQPIPSPTVCTGGNTTDVSPLTVMIDAAPYDAAPATRSATGN